MATPANLLALHTARRAAAEAARSKAEARLAAAQESIASAQKSKLADANTTANLEAEIAVLRAQLANPPTAADGEAMLAELEEKLIQLRALQSRQLGHDQAVASGQASISAASREITALQSREREAATAEASAKKRADRITAATDSLVAPPFDTLQAAATAAWDGRIAAEERVKADIPAALLERARNRRVRASEELSRRKAAFASTQDLGPTKNEAQTQRAEDALFGYLAQAKARLDQAAAVLARVADPAVSPLTDAARARIEDTDVVSKGTAAAAKEKARDDAQAFVDAAQAALDAAIVKALTTDPDTDPPTVSAVSDAQSALNLAVTALATAASNFSADERTDLDKWEAAVPEPTWRMAVDLEEAVAALVELKETDPATLAPPLQAAEAAWAAQVWTAGIADRARIRFESETGVRKAQLDFETNNNPHRRAIGLRGDGEGV